MGGRDKKDNGFPKPPEGLSDKVVVITERHRGDGWIDTQMGVNGFTPKKVHMWINRSRSFSNRS